MSATSDWNMELTIKRQRDGSQYLSLDRKPLPTRDGVEESEVMRTRRLLLESIEKLALICRALRVASASMPTAKSYEVQDIVQAIHVQRTRLAGIGQ